VNSPATKHFVVTGAPSSGKSTIIRALESIGFEVVPEAAREILESSTLAENQLDFQQRIEELQSTREEACLDRMVFFDRGLPDSLAYRRMLGFDESEILTKIDPARYSVVFMCRFGEHCPDGVRLDDIARSLDIERHIRSTYLSLGCEVVELPWEPELDSSRGILRRLEIISRHISIFGSQD